MGNAPRKGHRQRDAAGGGSSLQPRGRGRRRTLPGRTQLRPRDGDVMYPANELLQVSEGALQALRDQLAADADGFLLDNILMAVQFFRNYKEESSALQMAVGMRGALLTAPSGESVAHRVQRPDALAEAASRHVRWRSRGRAGEADATQALTAARRLVVSDNILLEDSHDPGATASCRCQHRHHYHLAMEAGPKPGLVKLLRVRRVCAGDVLDNDVAADLDDDNVRVANAAAVERLLLRPKPRHRGGSKSARAASPVQDSKHEAHARPGTAGSLELNQRLQQLQQLQQHGQWMQQLQQRRHKPWSAADSAISSEGSDSLASGMSLSLSDLSTLGGSSTSSRLHPSERQVALDAFRPGNVIHDADAVPVYCYQSVLTQSSPRAGSPYSEEDEDEDQDADSQPVAQPAELRLQSYLMATPFFAHFADVFHDQLAAAMAFPRESVVMATVIGGGMAAIHCDEDEPSALAPPSQPCEVAPALPLPGWPIAAAEWVLRDRAWPPRRIVRKVHDLGGVAVPSAHANELDSLQWTLAFPGGEQLLELSLAPEQAHSYLTMLALLRSTPGLTAAHIRASFLRQCEAGPEANAVAKATDSSLGWAPGRALRHSLAVLYSALRQRHLPDYFVSERNLLDDIPLSQVRRTQERVFRLRERLLGEVISACQRLRYAREDAFYPRFDINKLVEILTKPGRGNVPRRHADGAQHERRQNDDGDDWMKRFRQHCEETAAKERAAQNPVLRPRLSKSPSIKLGPHGEDKHRRTTAILNMFCDHFIRMGEASMQFRAHEQAWTYLRHSLHLLTLLERDYGCPEEASDFLGRVKKAERELVDTTMKKMCSRATSVYDVSGRYGEAARAERDREPEPRRGLTFGSVSTLMT